MQNNHKLYIEDLKSAASFRTWVKELIPHYKLKEVPDSDLLIYLDYIDDKVLNSDGLDKPLWSRVVSELKKRVEIIGKE
jgi:hypothetical protein